MSTQLFVRNTPIQHPRDFLSIFPENVLSIRSDANALSTRTLYKMPSNDVYLRHEYDVDKLYIPRSVFTKHLKDLDLLKQLRQYVPYIGVITMRIDRGVHTHASQNSTNEREQCYVFDLTKPMMLKDRIRAGHKAKNETYFLNEKLLGIKRTTRSKEWLSNLKTFMQELPDRQFQSAFATLMRDHAYHIDKSLKLHAEVIGMLERRKVQARHSLLKKAAPLRPRVRMPELDALIKLYALGFIRRVDAYKMIDGEMVHRKNETLPFPVEDKYDAWRLSGLYEETSAPDGSGYRKTLWIALHAVRDAVKQGKLPKNYMDDTRAVVKENKYLGKTTIRCLKLDMSR
jgi:hypothetical protein